MLSTKFIAQKNPFMYYSAFKISMYFKNNRNRCIGVHSVETKITIPQLIHKKVTQVQLDRLTGWEWCIDRCEQLTEKLHVAMIFSAYDETTMFAKYLNGKWYQQQQPVITETNRFVVSEKFKVLPNGFVVLEDVEANQLAIQNMKQ